MYARGSVGLQCIRREIRHTLTAGLYNDIDIENCQPTLLLQILALNGIEFKALSQYVCNRDGYLEYVQEEYTVKREDAKNLFIILMYGGSFDTWKQENNLPDDVQPFKFLIRFIKGIKKHSAEIERLNPAIKKQLESKQKDDNNYCKGFVRYSSVLAIYLQEIENRILEEVFLYCKSKGYIDDSNNCVLCYDGIMIPKISYKPELLQELHEFIRSKFKFELNFLEKPIDKYYTQEQIKATQLKQRKPDYKQLKFKFEENNFKVNNPVEYITIEKDGSLIRRTRKDFINRYEDFNFEEINKKANQMKSPSFMSGSKMTPSDVMISWIFSLM